MKLNAYASKRLYDVMLAALSQDGADESLCLPSDCEMPEQATEHATFLRELADGLDQLRNCVLDES